LKNHHVFVSILTSEPDSWIASVVLAAFSVTPAAVPMVNDPAVPMFATEIVVPTAAP